MSEVIIGVIDLDEKDLELMLAKQTIREKDAQLKVAIQAMQDTKWNMENDFGRCGTAFIDEALRKMCGKS